MLSAVSPSVVILVTYCSARTSKRECTSSSESTPYLTNSAVFLSETMSGSASAPLGLFTNPRRAASSTQSWV